MLDAFKGQLEDQFWLDRAHRAKLFERIAPDKGVYLADLSGKAATLAAGDKPKLLWRGDFGERIAATPAIADDTLFVRTETKLFAFKTAK